MDNEPIRMLAQKRFPQLLQGPLRRRVRGDVVVEMFARDVGACHARKRGAGVFSYIWLRGALGSFHVYSQHKLPARLRIHESREVGCSPAEPMAGYIVAT
jgi:hypothetical protein